MKKEKKEFKEDDDDKDNKKDHSTSVQKIQTENNYMLIKELTDEDGMVIEKNPDDPIAIYKGKNWNIHTFSAKCTHLGCTLKWNSSEKSFDCPCHGSRFYNNGKVINALANTALPIKKL